MKKYVEYMAVFEFIAVVAGIICYFTGHETITYFCAAFSLLHSFLNVVFGDQNGLGTEILTALVGMVVAVMFKLDMLGVVAVALCIGSVAFLVVPYLLIAIFSAKK